LSSAASLDRGGSTAALPTVEIPPTSRDAACERASDAAQVSARRSHWWAELLAIAWLLFLYDAVNNLAPLRLSIALGNARAILHVERWLHIDPELSLDRWLIAHRTLAQVLANYYDNAHFVVTIGLLGYVWWKRADIYRPLRNVLVLVNVIGFVVFWLFPVAPPRMLDGFTDVVAKTGAFGSWHTGSLASQANQLAAMPSLHMAWAGWCTLALWRITERRRLRALACVYPCVTAFAVLATGNHFVLDVIAGLLVLALSVWLVGSRTRLAGRWLDGLSARVGAGVKRRREERPRAARKANGTPAKQALRMSQSCYEVQDTVD
jgi:PAP2 superfamily